MIAAAAQEQEVSLTASTPPREEKIAPTTCSEAVEHEDRASAPTPTSLCLPHGPACGAASGSQNDAIFIPSDSESESESCEADEDVPSLRALNALIDKGTTTKPNSTSPAPTMPTVPYTPRAVISSLKVDDDLDGAVQHSPPPASLTTSAPQRQGLRNGLDSSRCSASISTAEAAEQDHEQAEDANEPLSSPCGNHGPSGPAELPRQTQPHESGSQNDSASIDADGNTADDGDRHSSRDADSDSSSDRNSGSDGDDVDDDYDDDGSPSDTDGEDGSHSKKRKTGRSPSVTGSDDGHADGFPSDDKTEEIFRPWSHKRQKLAHDREDTTPVRRQNSMPCSAGRLSQSPRRPQTASMLSPPASDSLSESESDKGSECSKASNERRRTLAADSEKRDRTD
ncbi:hypothetical protein ACQRIU_005924 [Beauveria bassiana]